MEDGFWAPYLFLYENEPTGIHAEIIKQAALKANVMFDIKVMPWKRCLEAGKLGTVDTVLSAAYLPDRAEFLFYPASAATAHISPDRISQVGYGFVTRKNTDFTWTGDVEAVPQPVGVPLGYATGERLKEYGISVTYGLRYDDIFEMLARGRVNALAIGSELAELYLNQEEYRGKLVKHQPDYETHSMFLPFSKEGSTDAPTRHRIWQAIVEVRKDPALMQAIRQSVGEKTMHCLKVIDRCH